MNFVKQEGFRGELQFLSNFAYLDEPIWFEKVEYSTVEHFFHAMKTVDQMERISIARAPLKGLKARGRAVELRPDWDEVKLSVMKDALEYKFGDANPRLRDKLLATGDMELIEHNQWGDTYWGVCKGVGKNHLGRLLMEVRDDLNKAEPVSKVIIAGGRDFDDTEALLDFMAKLQDSGDLPEDWELVSGMARGADTCGLEIAEEYDIPVQEYPAEWDTYGKKAGFLRNSAMSLVGDVLVAAWDGKSQGTNHMIKCMEALGKPVHILEY